MSSGTPEAQQSMAKRAGADAIAGTPGVALLGYELDADHNRSVITFAGDNEAVIEGAVRGVVEASKLIHIPEHHGVHPRVGAADVVPLVPVAEIGGRVIEDPQYFAWGLPGALPGCWVREGVADRLARAADSLPDGMMLLVWDGWRSIETQRISSPNSAATSAHRAWVQTVRGSLTTIWSLWAACSARKARRSARSASVIAARTRPRAAGRESNSLIPAVRVMRLWNRTAHLDSKKPLGLDTCGL